MLTEEKYLLITLFSHRKFNLYDFYACSCFSSGQIVRVLLKYQRKGYLFILGNNIVRTPYGTWKLKRVNYSKLSSNNRYWAQVPKSLTTNSITVNEPIVFSKISRR